MGGKSINPGRESSSTLGGRSIKPRKKGASTLGGHGHQPWEEGSINRGREGSYSDSTQPERTDLVTPDPVSSSRQTLHRFNT